jgi:hypothetical protein
MSDTRNIFKKRADISKRDSATPKAPDSPAMFKSDPKGGLQVGTPMRQTLDDLTPEDLAFKTRGPLPSEQEVDKRMVSDYEKYGGKRGPREDRPTIFSISIHR